VIEALKTNGYTVTVDKRSDTFARLLVSADAADAVDKVELAADWRSHPPVTLDIGPVLHPDDAVANKMAALYGRALPRDFLDIDAVLQSGRYTRDDLLRLAESADAGFDRHMFAEVLGALTQITDAALRPYGTTAEDALAMRKRFADWRTGLGAEAAN
jgi:hypothetical protein